MSVAPLCDMRGAGVEIMYRRNEWGRPRVFYTLVLLPSLDADYHARLFAHCCRSAPGRPRVPRSQQLQCPARLRLACGCFSRWVYPRFVTVPPSVLQPALEQLELEAAAARPVGAAADGAADEAVAASVEALLAFVAANRTLPLRLQPGATWHANKWSPTGKHHISHLHNAQMVFFSSMVRSRQHYERLLLADPAQAARLPPPLGRVVRRLLYSDTPGPFAPMGEVVFNISLHEWPRGAASAQRLPRNNIFLPDLLADGVEGMTGPRPQPSVVLGCPRLLSCLALEAFGNPEELHVWRAYAHRHLAEHLGFGQPPPEAKPVLYLERASGSALRRVTNADALLAKWSHLVERRSVAHDTSWVDQLRLFHDYRAIITVHGGQSANLLFATQRNAVYVELLPAAYASVHLELASRLGLVTRSLFGDTLAPAECRAWPSHRVEETDPCGKFKMLPVIQSNFSIAQSDFDALMGDLQGYLRVQKWHWHD